MKTTTFCFVIVDVTSKAVEDLNQRKFKSEI
jgi:hypothetical protein